jgi:phosphoglycolate phosphatase
VALGVEPSAILRLAAEFEDSIMRHTRPFDGVLETLAALRSRGVMVVAHTDTSERLAADRLVLLGLDGLVETLFTTDASQVTAFRSVHRWPERTEVVVLPYLKPDPRGVAAILERCGASRDECVYVGDSKAKDITLARNAGVRDVFAAYGCLRDTPTYDLLRSVSHWTDEDIVRENALRASASTEATHTLSSFRELLELL